MTEPCKRHTKRKLTGYRVVPNDTRTLWAVGERRECVKCGDTVVRLARGAFGSSQRDALQAYGCNAAEVDAYMATHHPEQAARERLQAQPSNTTKTPPIAVPLTSWPFPVSAHKDASC